MKAYKILFCLFLLASCGTAQESPALAYLEEAAFRFSLEEEYKLNDETKAVLTELVGDYQFVGIAEVHQSQQLSYFTTGLMELLKQKGFEYFALELGPNSAEVLQEIPAGQAGTRINELNRTYGKNWFPKIPLIFVDKEEDALFVDEASRLGYKFWGLDQEFSYSYEMHIDNLFEMAESPDAELKKLYQECKALIRKAIFKNKINGITTNCWLLENSTLKSFFDRFSGNAKAEKLISDLRISWDIYCKVESGKNSNQQRANYMKNNFDSYYEAALKVASNPKVLVKLGGVHLSRGRSYFRVDDVGKYLHQKGEENGTGFLSIRHLITYRNGKSNIGRSGWKNTELFLRVGRKDQWTLVDLRPLREKVEKGELTVDKNILFELKSYDLLLIPPDDKKGKLNY